MLAGGSEDEPVPDRPRSDAAETVTHVPGLARPSSCSRDTDRGDEPVLPEGEARGEIDLVCKHEHPGHFCLHTSLTLSPTTSLTPDRPHASAPRESLALRRCSFQRSGECRTEDRASRGLVAARASVASARLRVDRQGRMPTSTRMKRPASGHVVRCADVGCGAVVVARHASAQSPTTAKDIADTSLTPRLRRA
jgi:hypothetical protein